MNIYILSTAAAIGGLSKRWKKHRPEQVKGAIWNLKV